MSAKDNGPGVWWQFLEFMGMTWPGHKKRAADPNIGAPLCSSCQNPMHREHDRWTCAHHPSAPPTE